MAKTYKQDTSQLHKIHQGDTIIVVGNAPSLADTDMKTVALFNTIGCNRILKHPTFRPTYLMTSDRRPYYAEIEEGNYHRHAESVKILLSTTIFDHTISCHGTIAAKAADFRWYPWRVGVASSPFNWKTFNAPLCSFASISGPMIQAAVIMGAKRIGIVGIDMQMPDSGSGHFYGDQGQWECAGKKPGDPVIRDKNLQLYKDAFRELGAMGIDMYNLSPWPDTRFSREFGCTDIKDFVEVCFG